MFVSGRHSQGRVRGAPRRRINTTTASTAPLRARHCRHVCRRSAVRVATGSAVERVRIAQLRPARSSREENRPQAPIGLILCWGVTDLGKVENRQVRVSEAQASTYANSRGSSGTQRLSGGNEPAFEGGLTLKTGIPDCSHRVSALALAARESSASPPAGRMAKRGSHASRGEGRGIPKSVGALFVMAWPFCAGSHPLGAGTITLGAHRLYQAFLPSK